MMVVVVRVVMVVEAMVEASNDGGDTYCFFLGGGVLSFLLSCYQENFG